jgi:3-oxoacyl-[acyl-carrier-protein] synthase-3
MFLSFASGVKISSSGYFLPEQIISNQQLLDESGLPITDEWIKKRIGVKNRRRVTAEMVTSDMAIAAAKQALANQNIAPESIDLIILSTISPDNPNPSTACAVQAGLGIGEQQCPCFDISAACSGFIYALDTGARNILTGAKRVLVISAEIRSRFTNPKDPSTYAIFGDGAAAVVLEPAAKGNGMIGIQIMADGRGYNSVFIPAGGSRKPASIETVEAGEHFIKMVNGEKIFFEVVEGMTTYTKSFLEKCGVTLAEIDFVIPHQANLHILNEVNRRLALPEGKMLTNIQDVGNTSSASIPIVLAQNIEKGIIKSGSKVLMIAAGAGHTMGLALVRI